MIYTRNGAIVQLPAMGVLGTDMDDAAQQNVQYSVQCTLCFLQMIYTRNGAILQLPAMGVLGTDMDDAAQQNVQYSAQCILCLLQMIYTNNVASVQLPVIWYQVQIWTLLFSQMYNTMYNVHIVHCR